MDYDYKEGKKKIEDILFSKTDINPLDYLPSDGNKFKYDNGVRTWVSALFVDIRKSSEYFTNNKSEIVARVIRAFCSEIISIINKNDKVREIGIRGDCVYAIYSAPKYDDTGSVFEDAVQICTFQKMFQRILLQNNFPGFNIGIGLGESSSLVIKAGQKGTGINDYVWIGDAVIDASNLSSIGNKNGFSIIVMSPTFYENSQKYDIKISSWFKKGYYDNQVFYHGNVIRTEWNKWINEGMK